MAEAVTNADGRVDKPLLEGAALRPDTTRSCSTSATISAAPASRCPSRRSSIVVPLRFGVAEDAHYHVPLLVSPFAYSTYRGS